MTWDQIWWAVVNFFTNPLCVFIWIVGIPLTGVVLTTFGLDEERYLNLDNEGVLVFSFAWPIGFLWVTFLVAPLAIGHRLYHVRRRSFRFLRSTFKAVNNSFPWPWKVPVDKVAQLKQKNYRDPGSCSNCGSKIH